VIFWLGSLFISLNAALLGGRLSLLQCVCVLGYCLAPLNLASLLSFSFPLYLSINKAKILRLVLVLLCFIWSNWSALFFIERLVPPKKKILSLYPVCLFYLCVAWMVLVQ
jgi:hypothetical protein